MATDVRARSSCPLALARRGGESDESVVQRWAQHVSFQFFSGMAYFELRLPCDDSRI